VVFIPPEVSVDVVLVFVFVVKVGKGDVVAALALLVDPDVCAGVVAGISLVWRISSGSTEQVWAAGVVNPLVIPEWHHHVVGTGKEQDLVRHRHLADFLVLDIGRADQLLAGAVGEKDVPGFVVNDDPARPEFDQVVGVFDVGGIGEQIHGAQVAHLVHDNQPPGMSLCGARR